MHYHKVKDPLGYYQRLATRPKRKTDSSQYRGISWSKRDQSWKVQVYNRGLRTFIGTFTDEIEAAKAYNKYARLLIGEHAILNDIPD